MDNRISTPTSQRVTAELIQALTTSALAIRDKDGYLPFVVVPEGFKTEKLTPEYLEPLPDHIQQRATLAELESFIGYIKQFKTHTAQIFAVANDTGAQFEAVLNYHEGGAEAKAGRASHIVEFLPVYSPELQAWLRIHGTPLTQEQFLDHLRKWGDVITSHSDADLIELASALDFQVEGQFSSHTERTTGGRKLLFNETVAGTAGKNRTAVVPDWLEIKVPVFVGGRVYPISADILYRPQNGALRIMVELRRHHLVVRQAVKDIVADVKEGTGIEPFLGRLG